MNHSFRVPGAILTGITVTIFLAGCNKQKASSNAKSEDRAPTAEQPQNAKRAPAPKVEQRQDATRAPVKGGLRERITRVKVPEELHNLAIFYKTYFDTMNRAPSTSEEFRSYIEREAGKLAEAIKDKYYTVVCKIQDLRSGTVVAYEREADEEGKRWVVTGDAAARKMDENELQKALDEK
jgi:hypothetical protein